jgi:hypothetical protein
MKHKYLAVTIYVIFIRNFVKHHSVFQNSEGHARKQHGGDVSVHRSLRKETVLRDRKRLAGTIRNV